ncbi:hypothetical protein [Dyadobacter sp. Leaf189]|uniref:hypothetical protein n=1 Tax=Dyadobacter sp. Leaf189 TaxID=1736295 RepID=UPI0006FAE01B|nr:hypothetical protein [Dyadobacter sp. Leaf189]KQS30665.1 hypothetical protein ASG33_09735 [Dyadobacter sp. Leaf189]
MSKKVFDVPVLLITFNRPETTCHVFAQIRKLKPSKLYIFSDAARIEKPEENELVEACRSLFDDSQINWDCQVEKWFADTNMGCAMGVSSAISWAFETNEKLIILEDDCLPHPSFFSFCKVMLDKYHNNDRVMHVSGTRWNGEFAMGQSDHFFSLIGHIWGWATWKRAWNKYDFWMEKLPEMKNQRKVQALFGDSKIARYWYDRFNEVYIQEKKSTWDYQWQYTLFLNYGLSVVPNVNLVSNIGLEGVHSSGEKTEDHFCETWPWQNTGSQVQLAVNTQYERHHAKKRFMRKPPMRIRIMNRVKNMLHLNA